MIVLLLYSNNLLSQSKNESKSIGGVNSIHPSTGGIGKANIQQSPTYNDSVLVSYNDLKKANIKMIELKYERLKNSKLSEIINRDSVIISNYQTVVTSKSKRIKKLKFERNLFGGIGIGAIIVLLIKLL